jgi:hypothetical protein
MEQNTAPPHIFNDFNLDSRSFANGTTVHNSSGLATISHIQPGGHQQASLSRIPSYIEPSNQPNQSSMFDFSNVWTATFAQQQGPTLMFTQQSAHAAMVTQQSNPMLIFSGQQTQITQDPK